MLKALFFNVPGHGHVTPSLPLAAAILEATTNRDMQTKATALGEKITAEDGVGEAVKAVREFLA